MIFYTAKPQNAAKAQKVKMHELFVVSPLRICGFLRLCGVKILFQRPV
jgi:hypothetical protein